MVCDQCGRRVEPGDRFCTGCGTALASFAPPSPPDADDTVPADDTDPGGHTVPADDTDPADGTVAVDDTDGADPEGAAPATERLAVTEPSTLAAPPLDPATTQPIPTSELPETRPIATAAADGGGDADGGWGDDDPVWAATGEVTRVGSPATDGAAATADLPSTEPITEVWMETVAETSATRDVATAIGSSNRTSTMPVVATVAAPVRFRFGAVTLIGVLGGALTLVSLFTTVVDITSDERIIPRDDTPIGFRTGTWIADDLADNLAIAGLLAALVMVVGGVAAGFRWKWGSGLAGGGGLAFAGVAAIAIGLAQIPIDAAHEMARIPNEQQFTLTITRDVGYWLLIVAGAVGVMLFFASINDALNDRRPGLNPWIAAVGALAAVVTAGGPLLPENLATFSDNWYLVEAPGEPPAMLLVGRLVQLGLFAMTGVVGFLAVRRWGIGLAIGGALPSLWLAASTLFELTDRPVGPGFRNPGASDMHLHGVTIIGMSALAAIAVLAVIAAYDQSVHERR